MDLVALICRQTDYTEDEARAKLAEQGDPVKVIQEYMGVRAAPRSIGNANKLIYEELGKFVSSSFSGRVGKSSPPPCSTSAARTPDCSE